MRIMKMMQWNQRRRQKTKNQRRRQTKKRQRGMQKTKNQRRRQRQRVKGGGRRQRLKAKGRRQRTKGGGKKQRVKGGGRRQRIKVKGRRQRTKGGGNQEEENSYKEEALGRDTLGRDTRALGRWHLCSECSHWQEHKVLHIGSNWAPAEAIGPSDTQWGPELQGYHHSIAKSMWGQDCFVCWFWNSSSMGSKEKGRAVCTTGSTLFNLC